MRQVIRAENGFAYGAIGADIHVFGDGVPLYVLENWRPVAQPDPEFLRELPSRMLNARFAVVTFTGRRDELAGLRSWLQDGPRLAARWLHGPGGQGKTRLAAQLAQDSLAGGWKVVTATHGPGTVLPPPGSQDLRLDGTAGLLVIIDYADRWPLTHLTWLFSNALFHQSAVRTRILMLARNDDAWPAIRAALANHQAGTSSQFLPPLPHDDDQPEERLEMFDVARDSFATRYGISALSAADISPPGPLDDQEFGLILAVHIAALVAVDAHVAGRRPPRDMAGLTMYLLDREHLHWRRLFGDGDHKRDFGGQPYATPPETMNQAVFTAALTGSLARPAGTAALDTLELGTPAERVLDDHAVCYPPTGDTVLEPLTPDRLAEDFIALTLPGHQAEYPAQAWAAPTLAQLLPQDRGNPTPWWTGRTITFLVAAADRWPHLGPQHLYPLLRAAPELAVAAGSTALARLARHNDIEPALLEAIEDHFPDGSDPDLDAGIAVLTARLTQSRLALSDDPAWHAAVHHYLGNRLANAGMHQGALEATEAAASMYEQLARADPAEFAARFAGACSNLSARLSAVGRREEALPRAEEAVALLRNLANDNQAAHTQDLALALTNLGGALRDMGRPEEAVTVAQEAVALWRHLVKEDPTAHAPDFVTALTNLSWCLGEAGRLAEAPAVSEEAVAVCQGLAETNPTAFDPRLATALTNLSHVWSVGLGRPDKALAPAEEAGALVRRLAGKNPARFEPRLAEALSNLGAIHLNLRHSQDGLLCAEEAAAVLRRLAATNPAAFEPELANALSNLAGHLSVADRASAALGPAAEAVAVWRRLAMGNPAAFEPDLALSLVNLSVSQAEAGHGVEALDACREAVTLFRRLTAVSPARYEESLAMALDNLTARLVETGRVREALDPAGEVVAMRKRMLRESPRGSADLASSLAGLGRILADLGRTAEAADAYAEAVAVYGHLANIDLAAYGDQLAKTLGALNTQLWRAGEVGKSLAPLQTLVDVRRMMLQMLGADHEADLAEALDELAIQLAQMGRSAEAVAALGDAVALWRRLADAHPGRYEHALAQALHDLGIRLGETEKREDGLLVTLEATAIRRRLAERDPAVHEPGLAHSLHNVAVDLFALRRFTEAVSAAREATVVCARAAVGEPAAFRQPLATLVNNLRKALLQLGLPHDALAATEDAVSMYRQLADQDPAVFAGDFASTLNNLGIRLLEVGRHEEGLTRIREAVDVYRRLARQDPAAHSPRLVQILGNLSARLWDVGRQDESMAILREQVSVYSGLAHHSHEFIPGYADALADLGHYLSALGRATEALSASTAAVAVYRQVSGDPAVAAGTADALLLFAQVRAKAQRELPEALDAVDAAIAMYRRLPRPADAALRSAHDTRAHVLDLLRK